MHQFNIYSFGKDFKMNNNTNCHICSNDKITFIDNFNFKQLVSSDCIPVKCSAKLFICNFCGSVQKLQDKSWIQQTDIIYKEYEVYRNSGGKDQETNFLNNDYESRSNKLCIFLNKYIPKNSKGSMLEIGCGNGVFLKEFSKYFPNWKMLGSELTEKNKNIINKIQNANFYCGDLNNIQGKFDLIVLIHSLEHISNPIKILTQVKKLLNENGKIFIQVPNLFKSPFDLVIFDHCTHFYLDNIKNIMEHLNFSEILIEEDYIKKEISLLYKKNIINNKTKNVLKNIEFKKIEKVKNYLISNTTWLKSLIDNFYHSSKNKKCGIFGSSISGTFLFNYISENTDFFVDNDINKIGKVHLGKKIISPIDAPKDLTIFLPFREDIAKIIFNDSSNSNLKLELPPQRVRSLYDE